MNELRIPSADTKGITVTATPTKLPTLLGQAVDLNTSAAYFQNTADSGVLYVGYKTGVVAPAKTDMLQIAVGAVGPFPWPRESLADVWLAGDGEQAAVVQEMKSR